MQTFQKIRAANSQEKAYYRKITGTFSNKASGYGRSIRYQTFIGDTKVALRPDLLKSVREGVTCIAEGILTEKELNQIPQTIVIVWSLREN